MAIYKMLSNLLSRIERSLTLLAGIGLVATMILIVIDVAMRYYFRHPLTWWYDLLTNYVMYAMFYLAFSEALKRHEHLSIDVLNRHLPKKLNNIILSFIYLVSGLLIIYIGYYGLESAASSYMSNEVLAGLIEWPVWPTKTIAGLSFLALGLRACLMVNGSLTQVYEVDEFTIGTE